MQDGVDTLASLASHLPAAWRRLRSVAIASFHASGRLLDANAGFERLCDCRIGDDVTALLQQPSLATLRQTLAADAPYQGLLTLGRPHRVGESLTGTIHRQGDIFFLIAEPDLEETAHLTASILRLNEELTRKQRELVRLNRALARSERRYRELSEALEQRVAARTAALNETVEELTQFSYTVSHHLRSPLRVINGYVHFLEEDLAATLDATSASRLDLIKANTRRMGKLIDSIIDYAKLGRQPLAPRRVAVVEVWRILRRTLLQGCPRNLSLRLEDAPDCHADPALVERAFRHLLENAVAFSAGRERPTISLGFDPQQGAYFVKDNGIGFDAAHAEKLFALFERLDPTRDPEGVGAGLAFVERIAARHGGRVWAEGAPGKGAVFYLHLPLAPVAKP